MYCEDQHADAGVALADLQRGFESFVGEARRHPHVHQYRIGPQAADAAHEILGVVGLGQHVEVLLSEQPDDSFPE